jgi:hypothetical protein
MSGTMWRHRERRSRRGIFIDLREWHQGEKEIEKLHDNNLQRVCLTLLGLITAGHSVFVLARALDYNNGRQESLLGAHEWQVPIG